MVEKELPAENICVYLPNTLESFDDVVRVLALKVGTANADKPELTNTLVAEIARSLEESDRRLVVLFDQSERMYLATIERIRKMLDRVNVNRVLLQIVFAGRKSLLENLQQLAICNFSDVEEKHFVLNTLGLSETYAYLNHCAQHRSPTRGKNIFTPEAAKKIYSMAQGNLRMTNILAAKSLEATDSETSFMVLLDNVCDNEKVDPHKRKSFFPKRKPPMWQLGLVGAGLMLMVGTLLLRGGEEQTKVSQVTEKSAAADGIGSKQRPAPPAASEDGSLDGRAAGTVEKEVSVPVHPVEPKTGVASTKAQNNRQLPDNVEHLPEPEKKTVDHSAMAGKVKSGVAAGQGSAEPVVAKVGEMAVNAPEESVKTQNTSVAPLRIDKEIAEKGAQDKASGDQSAQVTVASLTVQERTVAPRDQKTAPPAKASKPETSAQNEPAQLRRESMGEVMEESENTEGDAEAVVFVGMKKRLPQQEADREGTKKIVKIAPVKVKAAVGRDSVEDQTAVLEKTDAAVQLFKQREAAGAKWLSGEMGGSHTIQLMALTAEQAEDNLRRRFEQEMYRHIADNLYIVKGTASTVFVYYGEYPDMDSARQARNTLPVFLRKHDPYAVSLKDAIEKAASAR
jgi:septal ring-binding cell division protein DamX/type II secretory pathway predicted ATPase ExeA